MTLGGTLELIALLDERRRSAVSRFGARQYYLAILVIVGQQSIATGIAIALPVAAAGQVLTVLPVPLPWCSSTRRISRRRRPVFVPSTCCTFPLSVYRRCALPFPHNRLAVCQRRYGQQYAQRHSGFVTRGLQIAGGFIVVVGYAMVLRMMGVKPSMPFFFLGFIAGGYLDFSLLAFGGVGAIIALVYIQFNPQWRKTNRRRKPPPQALDQLED
ncbi:PTS sugar transporter subunit IIC [Shigella flexneri]